MHPRTTHVILTINSIFVGLSLAATSATSPASHEDELLRNATLVFEHAVETPAAAIPASVLMRAMAIAVIPAAVKDGTRYYGNGIVSARGARADDWTPPAVIAFEGGIPLDLEIGTADLILVAQTQRGLDYFLQGGVRNTATLSTVAGPLGHDTPVRTNTDLLAYMKFGNYLAGVTIDDCVLREIRQSNAALYGRPYSTDDIVRGAGFFHIKGPIRMWRDALAAYFRELS
jgi:lipid-binding SYLF domain-containing protein